MSKIVIGILALFMLVVIGILRAILTQPDAKRSDQNPRWVPQRRKDKPSLMMLCIGCHSEQPGGYHSQLKESRDYRDFMGKCGDQWRFRPDRE